VNKNNATTAGAILLAGLMLHPLAMLSPPSSSSQDGKATSTSAEPAAKATEDGPWNASCEYWAPSRMIKDEEKPVQKVSITLTSSGKHVDSHVTASDDTESSCNSKNPWGFPDASDKIRPQITAIIATVPDPLHAHEALEFDRTIDALLLAAADNDYVESYYWIPWKEGGESGKDSGISAAQEHSQEDQPGLIILKYVPPVGDSLTSDHDQEYGLNYARVIYLFLVEDTPVLGMNGTQLENAFHDENDLQQEGQKGNIYFRLTMAPNADAGKPGMGSLAVIGSASSGSAASLRAGIERAHAEGYPKFGRVDIAGGTATQLASDIMTPGDKGEVPISYVSFEHNAGLDRKDFLSMACASGYDTSRISFLIEDGTVYGQTSAHTESDAEYGQTDAHKPVKPIPCGNDAIDIRFPRGISLLRNAHKDDDGDEPNIAPSPYLHLSLQDSSSSADTIPDFAAQMPLSQEAQLLAIASQLKRSRTQFVYINASSVLDQIFLAKFLHQAVPDARIVFNGGDLLYEREGDNAPFIGTVTLTPYNLIAPVPSDHLGSLRPFANGDSLAVYNEASYTFWNGGNSPRRLADYRNIFHTQDEPHHPSLWAVTTGRDGYYPLGIIDACASDNSTILPSFQEDGANAGKCEPPTAEKRASFGKGVERRCEEVAYRFRLFPGRWDEWFGDSEPPRVSNPSLWWYALCCGICGLCLFHAACLRFPNYWSPFTRDLAVDENDEPKRRSVYIHIGTVVLFCMAIVTAYPVFPALRFYSPAAQSVCLAIFTLLAATTALAISLKKTAKYSWRKPFKEKKIGRVTIWYPMTYLFFHLIACAATIVIPLLWIYICEKDYSGGVHSYAGMFFSSRCLNPASGVAPLTPVLLLLFSWYLWSVIQTRRLRFSDTNRPRLPLPLEPEKDEKLDLYQLFVSDKELTLCDEPTCAALYENITCLLITPEIVIRTFPRTRRTKIYALLTAGYLALFLFCVFCVHVESLDRIFWKGGKLPSYFELLIDLLFFPLLMVALAGWMRIILIWCSLRSGLLKRLEQLPIRSAFGRLSRIGWMSLMRQSDLHERWREVARSMESMRQMVHNTKLNDEFKKSGETIEEVYKKLASHFESLLELRNNPSEKRAAPRADDKAAVRSFHDKKDIPEEAYRAELLRVYLIENDYADFARRLLQHVLIPYWQKERCGFVEGHDHAAAATAASSIQTDTERDQSVAQEPAHILLAEEFVAIRYVSLVRGVLVNLRHLLTFVSCAFVLTIVAWNSYPFQPREWIDASFTVLLFCLGSGIVWVFAQMHRDGILSRITKTRANELGADFYLRIVTFGALPVLTWLAYQFPLVGSNILKFLQPGLDVMK